MLCALCGYSLDSDIGKLVTMRHGPDIFLCSHCVERIANANEVVIRNDKIVGETIRHSSKP